MKCLGIDIGSTGIKGAVLDLEMRAVRSTVREPFPEPLTGLPSGHFEVDPKAILLSVKRVLARLLEQAPDTEVLVASGQMGGVLLTDSQGAPVSNYYSWRDQRTLQHIPGQNGNWLDEIRRRCGQKILTELGNELHPGSTSSLLYWLRRHDQLSAQGIPATVADFALSNLCSVPPQLHRTHAIGLLDLNHQEFHSEALRALDLNQIRWPELTDLKSPLGHCNIAGRRLTCFASAGDHQCALRGADLQPGDLSLNISTGAQASTVTTKFEPGNYQSRCYFDGRYLNTLTHLPAGRSLNVLVNLLTEFAPEMRSDLPRLWDQIAQSASTATGEGLQVDLTFFSGPLGSHGAIRDITTENLSAGNLFRAAFSSMALNFKICAERLEPGKAWNEIVLSGGMTRSVPILRELIESQFSSPTRQPAWTEETLHGLIEIYRQVL